MSDLLTDLQRWLDNQQSVGIDHTPLWRMVASAAIHIRELQDENAELREQLSRVSK